MMSPSCTSKEALSAASGLERDGDLGYDRATGLNVCL